MSDKLIRIKGRTLKYLDAEKKLTGKTYNEIIEEKAGLSFMPKRKLNKGLFSSKRGNFPDVALYIRIALLFVLVFTISLTVLDRFNTQVQADTSGVIDNATKLASSNFKSATSTGWDVFFALLTLVFIIFSVVMARLIPSTPKFIYITFIALLALPFGAMIIENVWDSFSKSASLESAVSSMTFTPFIMNHLTVVTVIYCVLVGLALLTKTEETL